jgi:imidazolonepropionase-like amidohydrolase
MMKPILLALAAVASPALAQTAPSKISYIQAGALLDRPGQPPRAPTIIIVRDGKVAELRDGFGAPEAGATLVDLRGAFVLPGFVDVHVHL